MTEQQKRRLNDMLEANRQRVLEPDESANDEILALHRQLAAEKLRADTAEQRATAKSQECIELRERMAAAPASQAQAAPTGYKLLPIESTGLMDTAGMMELRNLLGDTAMRDDAEACYRAMIEAAPAAPAVIDQPTAAEIRARALQEAVEAADDAYLNAQCSIERGEFSQPIRQTREAIEAAIRALATKGES